MLQPVVKFETFEQSLVENRVSTVRDQEAIQKSGAELSHKKQLRKISRIKPFYGTFRLPLLLSNFDFQQRVVLR